MTIRRYRLNGITPPVGTLLPAPNDTTGIVVVDSVDENGVNLQPATGEDMADLGNRNPREVHSVFEHRMIRRRRSVFGFIREMG